MLSLMLTTDFKQKFGEATIEARFPETSEVWDEMPVESFLKLAYGGMELGRRLYIEFNEDTKEVAVACHVIARIKEQRNN